MADSPFQFVRKELMFLAILAVILVLEMLMFVWLAHADKIETFIGYFLTVLKLLTPLFLWLNGIIIVSTMFIRRKNLIIQPWAAYFKEVLKFSITSSVITIVFLGMASLLGVLTMLLLRQAVHLPMIEETLSSLRQWVRHNFY